MSGLILSAWHFENMPQDSPWSKNTEPAQMLLLEQVILTDSLWRLCVCRHQRSDILHQGQTRGTSLNSRTLRSRGCGGGVEGSTALVLVR